MNDFVITVLLSFLLIKNTNFSVVQKQRCAGERFSATRRPLLSAPPRPQQETHVSSALIG